MTCFSRSSGASGAEGHTRGWSVICGASARGRVRGVRWTNSEGPEVWLDLGVGEDAGEREAVERLEEVFSDVREL